MNKRTLAAAALGAGLLLSGGAIADDDAAITKSIHDAVAAVNACNADGYAKLWSEDGTIIIPDGRTVGSTAQEVAATREACAKGLKFEMTVDKLTVRKFGDVAVVTNMWHRTVTTPDGKTYSSDGLGTAVMIKQDGAWKAVHAHVSLMPPPPETKE